MRALFTFGADVPLGRVLGDHRRWLVPAGIVLAINVLVLVLVVVPLQRSVESGSARADASGQSLREAMADLRDAEATRDGQAQATTDLDRFYAEVLPVDFASARRITHVKLQQLARSHDVTFESGSTSSEELEDSTLERLHVNYALSGDWDDIRQLIYEVETGPDFIVIDNLQLVEGEVNAPLSLSLDLSTYYRTRNAQGAPGARGAQGPPRASSSDGR
jgi:Tfp pilus assembly protein PilO